MSAASAATGPAPATVPTAVVPTADEAAAVPVPALPTAEYLDGMAAFYKRCLAAYDARNHEGSSGRKTACDTHRIYAITELSAKCAVRGEMERERGRRMDRMSMSGIYERAPIMTICVCSPASPFACALDAMERGQLPREIDLEMLRGPNYGLGGKQVWPKPFADWASRWSKKRAGDAPASVETDGGGASATEAAHAAVAELLRAAANHPSRHAVVSELPRGRIRAFARRASFPPIPLEHRRVAPSPLSRLVVSCRHLRRACARRGDASERDRTTTPPPRVDAAD